MMLVLVCDESTFVRHMMVSMLSNLGLRAVLASNGIEGLAMVKSFHPDLVIAEVDMQEISGIELFHTVRDAASVGQLPRIPWVLMGSPGRQEDALATGCAEFVPKPIQAKALARAVDSALDTRVKHCV